MFRGVKTDVSVNPVVLREPDGAVAALLAQRGLDFFNSEVQLVTPRGARTVDLPKKSTIQAYVDGQLVVTLEQDWPQKGFKEGDMVAFDLAAVKADPADLKGTLVLRPSLSQSIEEVTSTRHRLAVVLYDNVKAKLLTFRHEGGAWTSAAADLPKDSTISVSSTSDVDDRMIVAVTSFLTPSSQWLADGATGKAETLKTTPARFDASRDTVEQLWATSKDGTKIPYWVVRPKGLKLDGTAPTLLTAYGGFQLSQTPTYAAMAGKLWLEKGGVCVQPGIRRAARTGPALAQRRPQDRTACGSTRTSSRSART